MGQECEEREDEKEKRRAGKAQSTPNNSMNKKTLKDKLQVPESEKKILT